jgi:hypothetical protein
MTGFGVGADGGGQHTHAGRPHFVLHEADRAKFGGAEGDDVLPRELEARAGVVGRGRDPLLVDRGYDDEGAGLEHGQLEGAHGVQAGLLRAAKLELANLQVVLV